MNFHNFFICVLMSQYTCMYREYLQSHIYMYMHVCTCYKYYVCVYDIV